MLSYLKGLFISLQAWCPKVADAFDKNPCIFQVPSYWASKSNECKWCTLSAVYCIVRTLSSHITCSVKEGVLMSDPLEKDPSDAVENRRRAAVQSSTSVEIQ